MNLKKNYHNAAMHGEKNGIIIAFRAGVNLDCADSTGWTALHWAARNGRSDIIKMLIERGANIDAVDCANCSPLMYASLFHHLSATVDLLFLGADETLITNRGDDWIKKCNSNMFVFQVRNEQQRLQFYFSREVMLKNIIRLQDFYSSNKTQYQVTVEYMKLINRR